MFSMMFVCKTTLLKCTLFKGTKLCYISTMTAVLTGVRTLVLMGTFSVRRALNGILFTMAFLVASVLSRYRNGGTTGGTILAKVLSSMFFLILSRD